MPKYKYDLKGHTQPAPVAEVIVSTNIAKVIGIGEDVSIKVKMLINTGADISFIPKIAIKELEKSGGNKLPYDMVEVENFNGERLKQKVYSLTLLLQPDGFGDGQTRMFLETDAENGILGRDVLNEYHICFDGKNLKWTISND